MSQNVSTFPAAAEPRSILPAWWVVFRRELTDLWVGGKGITLLLVYSLVLGLWSYVMASNTELRLIPPKEMVWEMLEACISVGSFICLIATAETISGDRERGSLEALLLTPTSRRQLVMGKFAAMMSLWPAILAVTLPYLAVLAQGTGIFLPAAMWGAFCGTVLVLAIGALGMVISLWTNSLKSGMFTALGLFILIFMPFALPGHAQAGPMGFLLQLLSPLMATYDFLAKILVNNRALTDPSHTTGGMLVWHHLISPMSFSLLMLTLLWLTSASLRIEAGKLSRPRTLFAKALGILAAFALTTGTARAANAQASLPEAPPPDVRIGIDKDYALMNQGDSLVYHTQLTNHGTTTSPPLTVAMNIINLDSKGDVVDPEDWSRRRTQYHDGIPAGQTIDFSWTVNGIMDGDYMLYMVVIPKPDQPKATTQPATSTGIHLTISPRVKLNPKGILAYVIGTPALLLLGMFILHRRRRKAALAAGD
jgi:ABC-type transport system involved in multi-copper enzyme maturation permease subunit